MKDIDISEALPGVDSLSQRSRPEGLGGPPNITTHHEPRPDKEQVSKVDKRKPADD